jgi:hypothetical protein
MNLIFARNIDNYLGKEIRTLFMGEIQRNCDFALVAYGDMTKYIQPTDKETLDRFWLSALLIIFIIILDVL